MHDTLTGLGACSSYGNVGPLLCGREDSSHFFNSVCTFTGSRAEVIRPCSGLREGYGGYGDRGTGRLRGDAWFRERITASDRGRTRWVIQFDDAASPLRQYTRATHNTEDTYAVLCTSVVGLGVFLGCATH
jgi:hypothetical protein